MVDIEVLEIIQNTLYENFIQYFDVSSALSALQKDHVYSIRYRVYCEEFGYEPIEVFPDKLESDAFDEYSTHCLITHKTSGTPAGCVRLVHVNEDSQMPMEKYCRSAIDDNIIRSFDGQRDTICELSRLAVDGAFRRRAGERVSRFGHISAIDFSQQEQRTFSLIATSSILAAFAMSDLIGRPHCFAMMEPFLPRILEESGIMVHPAGQEIDYHGMRAPYYIDTSAVVSALSNEMREFYENVRHLLATQPVEAPPL